MEHLVIILIKNPGHITKVERWKARTGKPTTVVRFNELSELPKELDDFLRPNTKELWIGFSPYVNEQLLDRF
jgi:hypothetical protein